MRRLTLAALLGTVMGVPAAIADTADGTALIGQDWDAIVEMARGGEVNWFMWGGGRQHQRLCDRVCRRHPDG